jgi:uncharacterized protein with HEPN domain
MTVDRLVGYLNDMDSAARKILAFTKGMTEQRFSTDERTQMAVMMALALIGESVAKIDIHFPDFPNDHPEISRSRIKGMRNLIVHDYYRAEVGVIWQTATVSIPTLLNELDRIRNWHAQGE